MERRSDPRLAAKSLELGRYDPRVVEDEGVAGAEQVRKLADDPVLERIRTHEEQPRAIAGACRPQRDALGRKLEIEEVDPH